MHYEISLAMKPGKQLTATQKRHPYFSEAPKIGSRVLRRGVPIRMSEQEFKLNEVVLKRLLESQSIEIHVVDEGGKVQISKKPATSVKAEDHVPAPVAVPVSMEPAAADDAMKLIETAPAPEPAKPVEVQPIPEPAPVPAPAPGHDHKGKKGRK